jgi:uncharacterized protein HemX
MSNTATAIVGGLLLAVAAGIGGYGYGLDQGKALEKGRQDAKALETITDQINAKIVDSKARKAAEMIPELNIEI